MTELELAMWYLLIAMGLIGSALFSGLETGIYSLNRVRLYVLGHSGYRGPKLIMRMIDQPNQLLTTLLIANNLTNYMASLGIAVLLESMGFTDWQMIAINASILTPLLFVLGETLPKDLYQQHSDRFVYPFAVPLWLMQKVLIFTGLLPVVNWLSMGLRRLFGVSGGESDMPKPRHVVRGLFKEGMGQGVISAYQSDMIDRVIRLERQQVRDVMVPWSKVLKVRDDASPEMIWEIANQTSYSRVPAVDRSGRPLGWVPVFDVLLHEVDACPPIRTLIKPIPQLSPDTLSMDALVRLRSERASIAVIADGTRPIGLVTIKDLVEPITGELDAW